MLGNDGGWLQIDPESWKYDDGYRAMEAAVCGLSVVNDTAVRVIKKMTEYANVTKDEHWGEIVEVAAWHHGKMASYTKEELEANVL